MLTMVTLPSCWVMASPLPIISRTAHPCASQEATPQTTYCELPTIFAFTSCAWETDAHIGSTSPMPVCIPASCSATTKKKIQQFPPHPNTGTESSCSSFILTSPKGLFLFQDQNIHLTYTYKFSIGLLSPLELDWATYIWTDLGAYFVFLFSRLWNPWGRDHSDICISYSVLKITSA